jgi:hypothetical protein
MLITYAMTLGSKIAIGDQRRIIPSIHRAGLGFKEAWGVQVEIVAAAKGGGGLVKRRPFARGIEIAALSLQQSSNSVGEKLFGRKASISLASR